MNLIDHTNEASERFSTLFVEHKERILKQVTNGALLFVILAVFGCFDFVTWTFNFDMFDFVGHTDVAIAYWTKVLAKTIAGICAFNIGMNLRWDKEMSRNVVLRDQIGEYERLMRFKDQNSFELYVIKYFNPAEKKKAWIDSVNKKIHRLNRFASHKNQILYTQGSEEEKKKSRYCRKRGELEKMKSDDWVDKNLDSLFVRYYFVDPISFDLGVDGETPSRGAKVTGNVAVAKAKHTSTTLFGIVGATLFTTAIMIGADQKQFEDQMQAFWYYFLSCLEDTLVVVWQAFKGMVTDKKIINSEFVVPYTARVRVLNAYIDWCGENKIPESKAYRILKTIEAIEPRKETDNEFNPV